MSFEEQNMGSCPYCREYEQERQRLQEAVNQNFQAGVLAEATITELRLEVARLKERVNELENQGWDD